MVGLAGNCAQTGLHGFVDEVGIKPLIEEVGVASLFEALTPQELDELCRLRNQASSTPKPKRGQE